MWKNWMWVGEALKRRTCWAYKKLSTVKDGASLSLSLPSIRSRLGWKWSVFHDSCVVNLHDHGRSAGLKTTLQMAWSAARCRPFLGFSLLPFLPPTSSLGCGLYVTTKLSLLFRGPRSPLGGTARARDARLWVVETVEMKCTPLVWCFNRRASHIFVLCRGAARLLEG